MDTSRDEQRIREVIAHYAMRTHDVETLKRAFSRTGDPVRLSRTT